MKIQYVSVHSTEKLLEKRKGVGAKPALKRYVENKSKRGVINELKSRLKP